MRASPSTAPASDPSAGAPAGGADDRAPGDRARPGLAHRLRHAVVLVPLLVLLLSGARGLDFGHHWDESIQVENLQRAVQTQTLLPKWYRYPSVLFWMSLGALAPEIVAHLPRDGEEMEATQDRLTRLAGSGRFRLRLRAVFLAVTSMTLLWTYAAAFLWRRSVLEGLLAASLVGLSFEVAYHARWVAPDGVLMQFAALTLLLCTLATNRRDTRWLWAAAIAAGLGCGTKYTGGILFLPVLVAAWQVHGAPALRAWIPLALGLFGTFALAFVLSTPGAVLQPFVFFRHVGFEIEHYRTGHYGSTIDAGLPHLGAMLRYLGAHLFSPYSPLALATSALALAGLVGAARRSPRHALLVACTPLVYLVYMSSQRVLFVRNLLIVAPMLAMFAAWGLGWLSGLRASRSGSRPAAPVGILAAIAVLWALHTPFLFGASQSIRQRDVDRDVRAAHTWIAERPQSRVFVSQRLARRMAGLGLELPSNATGDRHAPVDAAAFFPADTPSNTWLLANRPGQSLAIFGPQDVNFAYYPAWPNPKVVVYPERAARRAGILAPVTSGVTAEE